MRTLTLDQSHQVAMRTLTLDQSHQVAELDRLRTDGGLGVVFNGRYYQCRDVLGDPSYGEYQNILAASGAPPQICSKAQGQLTLLQAGLLDAVENWIKAQDKATQIEYASRGEWRSDWPLVVNAAAALGLSEEQLQDFFTQAATL